MIKITFNLVFISYDFTYEKSRNNAELALTTTPENSTNPADGTNLAVITKKGDLNDGMKDMKEKGIIIIRSVITLMSCIYLFLHLSVLDPSVLGGFCTYIFSKELPDFIGLFYSFN